MTQIQPVTTTRTLPNNAVTQRGGHFVVMVALWSMVVAYAGATYIRALNPDREPLMLLLSAGAGLGTLSLVLLFSFRKLSRGAAISFLTLIDVAYITISLVYLTLLQADTQALLYSLSSEFLWTITTPMLAYGMRVSRAALRALWVQPILFSVTSLLYFLFT